MSNKDTNKTQEEVLLPTLKQASKAVVQSTENTFKKLLPVEGIKNIVDAELILATVGRLDNRLGYAKAKALQTVNNNPEWYTKRGYKSVYSWAQARFGIGESMARNYLKAAEYIVDDGSQSVFEIPDRGDKALYDFSVSAIAEAIQPSGLTVTEIDGLIAKGRISPAMKPKDLKAIFKKYKAKDVDEVQSTETDDGATDDGANVEKVEKLETIKLSFAPVKSADITNLKLSYTNADDVTAVATREIPQGAHILVVYGGNIVQQYHYKGDKA